MRHETTDTDEGTPVYGDTNVHQGVRARIDVVPDVAYETRQRDRTIRTVRKTLLTRAKHQGQDLQLDYDMTALIAGVRHRIIAIAPVGGRKPLYLDVTLTEVNNA